MPIVSSRDFMKHRVTRSLANAAAVLATGLLLAAGVLHWVWGPVRVPTESMSPSIAPGDVVWVLKAGYSLRLSHPQRGDIVLFRAPSNSQLPGKLFIKRVVALEGDTVAMTDNQLMVNGRPATRYVADMRYGLEQTQGGARYPVDLQPGHAPATTLPQTIPPGAVYILGDNRGESEDSRKWGPVPLSQLRGVAYSR